MAALLEAEDWKQFRKEQENFEERRQQERGQEEEQREEIEVGGEDGMRKGLPTRAGAKSDGVLENTLLRVEWGHSSEWVADHYRRSTLFSQPKANPKASAKPSVFPVRRVPDHATTSGPGIKGFRGR